MHSLTEIRKLNTPVEIAKAQAYARALNGSPTVSRQKCRVIAVLTRALPISSAFIAEQGKPWRTREAKLC